MSLSLLHQILRRQDLEDPGPADPGPGAEEETSDPCGASVVPFDGLRVAAIFIVLITSMFGTLFPVLSKRVKLLRRHVPGAVFEFAKFFGSGVILTTGFIHLLEPATDALGEGNTIDAGGCISNSWSEYPYAFGISLVSLFGTFVLELVAFRVGKERLEKMGISDAPNPHAHAPHTDINVADSNGSDGAHDPEKLRHLIEDSGSSLDKFGDASENLPAAAQIIGTAILEFGVILHSLIIGLTLSVTSERSEYVTLFIVIIFHQMFEGLGVGTRLAFLRLPSNLGWVPFAGALLYSIMTPLGMSIGLGIRSSLAMSGNAASVASGVLDALSSGILIYTATVELMAHEFVFNDYYHNCSWGRLTYALGCFAFGAGIMALLGKWA